MSQSEDQAGNQLQLSTRQIRRLLRSYEASGAEGLATKLRSKASNRKLSTEHIKQVIELISKQQLNNEGDDNISQFLYSDLY